MSKPLVENHEHFVSEWNLTPYIERYQTLFDGVVAEVQEQPVFGVDPAADTLTLMEEFVCVLNSTCTQTMLTGTKGYVCLDAVVRSRGIDVAVRDLHGFGIMHYLLRHIATRDEGYFSPTLLRCLIDDPAFGPSFGCRDNCAGQIAAARYFERLSGSVSSLPFFMGRDVAHWDNWYSRLLSSSGGQDLPDASGYTLLERAYPVVSEGLFHNAALAHEFDPSRHRMGHILESALSRKRGQPPMIHQLVDAGLDDAPLADGRRPCDIIIDAFFDLSQQLAESGAPLPPPLRHLFTGENIAWILEHRPDLISPLNSPRITESRLFAVLDGVEPYMPASKQARLRDSIFKWLAGQSCVPDAIHGNKDASPPSLLL